ncbi:MAG: hypothetical protein ACXVDA_12570, partial [Ktedonobacterales bacterium]
MAGTAGAGALAGALVRGAVGRRRRAGGAGSASGVDAAGAVDAAAAAAVDGLAGDVRFRAGVVGVVGVLVGAGVLVRVRRRVVGVVVAPFGEMVLGVVPS